MKVDGVSRIITDWFGTLQEVCPELKTYGSTRPQFESKWDNRLLGILIDLDMVPGGKDDEDDGGDEPRYSNTVTRLEERLEARIARRTYQDTVSRFEEALCAAVKKHGEEFVALQSYKHAREIRRHGQTFGDILQKAGFVFKNPEFVHHMFQRAKQEHTEIAEITGDIRRERMGDYTARLEELGILGVIQRILSHRATRQVPSGCKHAVP